jgi:hypothetical protein
VSDAAAGIACVLVVAEAERGEAERLVGAHRASVGDKDPLAPVVVAGRLTAPVIVASGVEAGEFLRRTDGLSGGGDFLNLPAQKGARRSAPFSAACDGSQARGARSAHTLVTAG